MANFQNKGSNQLRGYSAADLRLHFSNMQSRFSHDAAQMIYYDLYGCNKYDFQMKNCDMFLIITNHNLCLKLK